MLSPEAAALRQSLRQQVLGLSNQSATHTTFSELALAVFRYQAVYNPVYRQYLHYLNCQLPQITDLRQIPFMPIGFFKTQTILTGTTVTNANLLTFASSGTTNTEQTSRHYVADSALYDAVSTQIFEQTYGSLRDFHILALLPSYLERNNSSLVYMVQRFMAHSGSKISGFFLNNYQELTHVLRQLANNVDGKKILLIGVTFGLLDWAESGLDLSFLGQLSNLIVMETGGMKGRRKELLREEVHAILKTRLGIPLVHSEYGMTELLSQAYSLGEGVFQPSATLRVLLRDTNDPFLIYPDIAQQAGERRTGGINVVDLANLDSCSFLETQDLGQYVASDGSFRVMGRFDNSDVRGCNLMVL